MEKNLVSVIVPIYKAELSLPKCIDSILAQTYSNFELLLVDDGSPDNSGRICDEYAMKDARIRVFHKVNGGVSSARNVGLREAKGEWITFCDADDWVEKSYLKNLLIYSLDTDLVIGGFKKFGAEIGEEQYNPIYILQNNNSQILENYMLYTGFRVVWGALYRSTIIQNYNLRFIDGLKIGEDTSFVWKYVAYSHSIKVLEATDYHYFVSDFYFQKYAMSYEELNQHIQPFNGIIELIEKQWNCRLLKLMTFFKQLYYCLFLKNILIHVGLIDYLRQRQQFIQCFGKEYSLKVHCVGGFVWSLFLKNRLSASVLYFFKRFKYIVSKKI